MSIDSNSKINFKVNNFDLIRLVAAIEVLVSHVAYHLKTGLSNSLGLDILNLFPGVPIFFFVSGFLISKSYESNNCIRQYAKNRILRVYPALIVCTILAMTSVYVVGYFSSVAFSFIDFFIWFLGQVSFVQFYTPDFMRGFGVGALNGSLWTISVELQFYILIPVFYSIFNARARSKDNGWLVVLIVVFMAFNVAQNYSLIDFPGAIYAKLYEVSFLPWVYMFMVGVLFQRKFDVLYKFLSGKFIYLLPIYLTISYVSSEIFEFQVNNRIDPILYFFLAVLVFSAAYSYTTLSSKILKGNDISYGLYIYHAPVINIMIFYGYIGSAFHGFIALLVSLLLAVGSWLYVERTSLKLKNVSMIPTMFSVK